MPESMTEIEVGRLALPDSWEMRVEVSCLEPRKKNLPVMLAKQSTGQAPRANLVVSRRRSEAGAAACLKNLLSDLAKTCQGLKIIDRGEQSATNGMAMPYATVSFEVEGSPVLQRYWFRVDQGVATQLTGTVDHASAAKLDGALTELALSFEPPGSAA